MRNRRDILDRTDFQPGSGDSAHGGFTAGARPLDANFHFLHAQELRLLGRISGNHLRRVSGALARPLETVLSAGGPAEHVAVQVGEGHFRIVERRQNIGDAGRHITAALSALLRSCSGCAFRGRSLRNRLGILHFFSHDIYFPYIKTIWSFSFPATDYAAGGFRRASALGGQTTLGFVADGADRDLLALAGTSIGFGTLAADRQVPAVTNAAVAVDLLQSADVGGELAAEVALHGQIVLQNLGDLIDLIHRNSFNFNEPDDVETMQSLVSSTINTSYAPHAASLTTQVSKLGTTGKDKYTTRIVVTVNLKDINKYAIVDFLLTDE